MKKNLTVIGLGNIGEVFVRKLKPYFNILVANRSDKSKLAKKLGVKFTTNISRSVKNADYVILSVSIEGLKEVVDKIKNNISAKAVVIDTCAVKELPMKIMSSLPCNIMGTHPQFRNVKSLRGKSIILVGKIDSYFEKILKKIGLSIETMTAKKHDKQKVVVNLATFIGLVLIKLLNKKERNILEKYSGRASRNIIELIKRMEENSLPMYEELQRANPLMSKFRKKFIKAMADYDKRLDNRRIT